jgi:hypothetical protein
VTDLFSLVVIAAAALLFGVLLGHAISGSERDHTPRKRSTLPPSRSEPDPSPEGAPTSSVTLLNNPRRRAVEIVVPPRVRILERSNRADQPGEICPFCGLPLSEPIHEPCRLGRLDD